jgi:hypothetical protein
MSLKETGTDDGLLVLAVSHHRPGIKQVIEELSRKRRNDDSSGFPGVLEYQAGVGRGKVHEGPSRRPAKASGLSLSESGT